MKYFKFLKLIAIVSTLMLVSCAPNTLNKKATEIAKSFYTDYLKACKGQNTDKILKVKKTYMTNVMVEEINLRSKQMEVDAVLGTNDFNGMINKLSSSDGENDEWAVVTFDMFEEEEKPYNIYEIKLHFKDVDNKRFIDTLDMNIYDVDKDGDKVKNEFNTRWANKDELSDTDKQEMENVKKYFEDLES
ncbi:MAG: hypothetical protein J6M39_05315 [Lachnospiraceae bacterium]|nr:hypothetical protein [Lachnospiraceae bacterium]